MAITTLTQLPPEVRTYFDRMLLTLARPYFIYDLFAQKRQIPLNSGDQMVFARYGTLSAATIPLTDGQTPSGSQLSRTDFKAAISWYGDYVTISDQVQFVVQDRVLNEATKVLSLQLGLTIDTLIRDMMVSTASTIVASHGLNGTVPTEITDTDIQTAIIALRQGNARLMTNPLPGENKFGTAPVRSSYWGFMSVDLQDDLERVSSFISCANYPNPMNALEAEWGSTRNARWLLNTNGFSGGASVGGVSRPIYSSFLLGQEAYGVVRLGAKEAEFIVKPLGASGTADPLNQRGTVGYKYPFATRILNDNWITRIISTHS
jgi:N4-gp56 family major capsid protein